MTFVPITPAVTAQPSPNARELAEKLVATVREFEQSHPGTSSTEVQQAMQLASSRFYSSSAPALIAIALGLLVAGGLAAFYFANRGAEGFGSPAMPMVLIAVVVLGLLGVFAAKKRF
jgi:hypothetical protein